MIAPLAAPPVAPAPEAADLHGAAIAFEALFLQQMLKGALPHQDGSGSLALQTLATQLAQGSPFGIARLLGKSAGETAGGPADADVVSPAEGRPQP
jgi:Rod binding domain-containing protein